jgi:hypothetical protein
MATYTDTQNGQNVYLAFEQLRTGYTTTIPGHTQQLRTLATRPISG